MVYLLPAAYSCCYIIVASDWSGEGRKRDAAAGLGLWIAVVLPAAGSGTWRRSAGGRGINWRWHLAAEAENGKNGNRKTGKPAGQYAGESRCGVICVVWGLTVSRAEKYGMYSLFGSLENHPPFRESIWLSRQSVIGQDLVKEVKMLGQ